MTKSRSVEGQMANATDRDRGFVNHFSSTLPLHQSPLYPSCAANSWEVFVKFEARNRSDADRDLGNAF